MAEPVECKSCGARIWYATTTLGKITPINAEPDPKGLWVLLMRGGELRVEKYDEGKHTGPEWKRRTSHFASCPNAGKHRRSTRGAARS